MQSIDDVAPWIKIQHVPFKLYINLVEIEIMKDVAKQTRTLPTAIETDFNRWVGGHLDVDREIFDEFLKKRQQGSQHKYQGRHHASEYLINRNKVTSLFKVLGISIPNTVSFPSLITIHPINSRIWSLFFFSYCRIDIDDRLPH